MTRKIILTSSMNTVARGLADKIDFTKGKKLAFIATPAEVKTGDLSWLKRDRQSLVDIGFEVEDYTIKAKSKDQLVNDLAEYQHIYVSGGNTVYFLQKAQESSFIEVIKDLVEVQGKTYIATSAGSIIAGPICPEYLITESPEYKLANDKGLDLVNFTVLPHWGLDYFKERYMPRRMEIAYKADQVPLVLLTETQFVVVENDKMQIFDIK